MDRNNLIFFIVLGFGLLFLEPVAASVNENLGQAATFLILMYWGGLGLGALIFLLKNLFTGYGINNMLYNLWLFLSLMCVAVGILAIIDDGPEKAQWAVWMVLYGTSVGYIKRNEL